MGRPAKPTKLKLIEGNPGKRPLEDDAVNPPVAIPACPDHLNDEGRLEWERITPLLEELGLIGEIDRGALASYCQAYGRWVEAEREIATHGFLIKSPNGYPQHSPYLAIANKAMEQMAKYAAEFGMTPAARSRIKGTAQLLLPGFEDPVGAFLSGHPGNGEAKKA